MPDVENSTMIEQNTIMIGDGWYLEQPKWINSSRWYVRRLLDDRIYGVLRETLRTGPPAYFSYTVGWEEALGGSSNTFVTDHKGGIGSDKKLKSWLLQQLGERNLTEQLHDYSTGHIILFDNGIYITLVSSAARGKNQGPRHWEIGQLLEDEIIGKMTVKEVKWGTKTEYRCSFIDRDGDAIMTSITDNPNFMSTPGFISSLNYSVEQMRNKA